MWYDLGHEPRPIERTSKLLALTPVAIGYWFHADNRAIRQGVIEVVFHLQWLVSITTLVKVFYRLVERGNAISRDFNAIHHRQSHVDLGQRNPLTLVKRFVEATQRQARELGRQSIQVPDQPPAFVLFGIAAIHDAPQVDADRYAVDARVVAEVHGTPWIDDLITGYLVAAELVADDDIIDLADDGAHIEVSAAGLECRQAPLLLGELLQEWALGVGQHCERGQCLLERCDLDLELGDRVGVIIAHHCSSLRELGG